MKIRFGHIQGLQYLGKRKRVTSKNLTEIYTEKS